VAIGELVLVGVLVVLSFTAGYGYRIWRSVEPPVGPVERYLDQRRRELRDRYATGEISRQQFAAEIETVEDPATERIMHLARDVDGIGPHIAFKVAREFESVSGIATASCADLEAINRVGENRARALLQRARQEREEAEV